MPRFKTRLARIKGKPRPRPAPVRPLDGGEGGYGYEEEEYDFEGGDIPTPRPLPPGLVCCILIFLVSLFVSGLWVYEHFIDTGNGHGYGGKEEGVSKSTLLEKDTIFAPSSSISPALPPSSSTSPSSTSMPPLEPLLPSPLPPLPPPPPPPPPPVLADGVKWGVVVQGLLYPQGIGSWGASTLASVWPSTLTLSPPLTILCTWDTEYLHPLFAQYMGEGFLPCPNATMDDFQALGGTVPGALNVNFQKYTTYKGLLAAKAMGVTHAIKVRGDARITNPLVFIRDVLGPLTTLSFLVTWAGAAVRYPVDYLVAGPIEDVLEYFAPPFQGPEDGRFPELFLMEEFSRKRGWTPEDGPNHMKFCRGVDFFFPRLPLGVFFFDHKGNNDNRDMAGPVVPYRVSMGDICLLEPGQS